MIVHGHGYGYLVFSETLALYRNTDIFAEAHETWDELVQMATRGEQYGFAFQLLAQYYQGAFFQGFGSYIFKNNDGTWDYEDIGLNNEGGVEAAMLLRDMYQQPEATCAAYAFLRLCFP